MRGLGWMKARLGYAGLLLLVPVAALVVAAGRRTNADDGLALARVMPKGALAYVQARDFSDLFARWRRSQVHDRYHASDSDRAFRRSRLWAKLNERINEFETGVGVTLTEDAVARTAGKATAVALYDMGKLELVFVTELSAAQAAATPLLARKATFETRTAPNGQAYLVRELATDGGRLRQGLCVATPPGKLIVTTTEALMQRTLGNLGGQSGDDLLTTMAPTLAIAENFTPHDLTLWTDLPRLRRQAYFGYYWIHGAAATELNGVEATLADIEFAPDGVQERRWSLTSGRPRPAAFSAVRPATIDPLLGAAPFVVVETLAENAAERAAGLVVQAVSPSPRPTADAAQRRVRDVDDVADDAAAGGRYQRLDARFDRDLDDPNAPAAAGTRPTAAPPPADPLEAELAQLFRAAQPICVARLGETTTEGGSPFVGFERAVAVRFARPFDAKAYESVMARAIGRRYFVAGTTPPITWQTSSGGVKTPHAGAALERCGAYFVNGEVVVMASSAAYAERLKARLTGTERMDGAPSYNPSAHRQAVVRLRALAPDYQQVMRLIGPSGGAGLTPLDEEAEDESVPFLERNIASLLVVAEPFDVVTVESAAGDGRLFESVRYGFVR